jgi:peptidoglycan/xylan/chitin deacetylase (PgdA/CDA1 family)
MYHYIRVADPTDTLGVALSVTPQNFDAQMKWLKDNNFSSIHLADLADPEKQVISQTYANHKKPVVVTFDDGYDDAYTAAFPILKKYELSGTFFIIRAFVGRSEYATQAQIDEMAAAGMEIGSHTLNHLNLSTIVSLLAKDQIVDSKQSAEVFCYPSGRYNSETVQIVKDAGYMAAVTTKGGIANQDSSLFELPRLRIENISLDNFTKKFETIK